ncbi:MULTISPECIES: dTDP-4-dehydrorhamnose reductase [Brucella]|uniref:dTDP-4-dehydrorhamnose reductase n=1 Tax=Brucella TaxID=234 RepID=UPI00124F5174|nr:MULTISPECIES: dTDP-4-dehydrorhamnose reductase [Brucella]KAB2785595.1 dTDP-4-dehydrorhamnose reductase [Brucella anthropi]MDG9792605.1 dTDP-4-dehydrorhamnose reductase [Brucella anthropi]MDH0582419.1 dTDP-4-dehydrorhamnose reductase [Brucella anthropi]MDH0818761.1 dTDP-4-dehydrorhamnose reductase [Brucella anthropi]MDH2085836.1 dTDP-4-dehydrorhamnose reductase [Brucella anthropi]
MKILVTGREGQIVQSLLEKVSQRPDLEVIAIGRPELDLTRPETIHSAAKVLRPDLVVSVAAYTAVDLAEDDRELAFAVNARGAEAVAAAAKAGGIPVIHLSTDYVFAGDAVEPYIESDATGPRSVYGESKLEGEGLVARANPQHIILRTAWVYSPFGKNFVKTMLKLAETHDAVSVVSDQWGNPTSALDIANAIIQIVDHLAGTPDFSGYGIYHLVGTGDTNWSGFARAIFDESGKLAGPSATVTDIAAADYPTKAVRPSNSRLSTAKLKQTFGCNMPEWRTSLVEVVHRLV